MNKGPDKIKIYEGLIRTKLCSDVFMDYTIVHEGSQEEAEELVKQHVKEIKKKSSGGLSP